MNDQINLPVPVTMAQPPALRPSDQPSPLAPPPGDKAAILLAAMGPEPSAPLLNAIGPARARRFARILTTLPPTQPETVTSVMAEFLEQLEAESAIKGGRDAARSFLSQVLGQEELERAMADLGDSSPSVWRNLSSLPEAEIIGWLEGEHPNVAGIALAQLPSQVSARLLENIAPERARDLVSRMAQSAAASPSLIGRIAAVIETNFLPGARLRAEGVAPAGLIANVLNHVAAQTREEILTHLREGKPAIAAQVERIMFTFENIVERVNPRDAALVLRGVDEAILMKALKTQDQAGADTADFLFGNISKRLAERLRGDLDEHPDVSTKEKDEARAAVVAEITRLSDLGEITLIEPSDEEELA